LRRHNAAYYQLPIEQSTAEAKEFPLFIVKAEIARLLLDKGAEIDKVCTGATSLASRGYGRVDVAACRA